MTVANGPPSGPGHKALTEGDVLAQKPLTVVLSQSYTMYCPESVKAKIDLFSDSTTSFVEFHLPENATDFFYMVASKEGVPGAVPVRESKTRTHATVNVSVPMRVLQVTRPAKGRKERHAVEYEDNSPYGRALRVYTRALINEPTESRPRRRKAGQQPPSTGQQPPSTGQEPPITAQQSQSTTQQSQSTTQQSQSTTQQATSTGQQATSTGQQATSTGQQATSTGQQASSTGQQASSTGQQASSLGQQAPIA